MRRGSSTTIVLVGDNVDVLLQELGRSPNVSVVAAGDDGPEAAFAALAEAVGRTAPFVLVGRDPLSAVAEQWRRMWDRSGSADAFEQRADAVVAAWRAGRFELPDYYLVVADEHRVPGSPHPHELHLGVLHNRRPARVVAVAGGEAPEVAGRAIHVLRTLRSGPWWPSPDELMEDARSFYPGHLSAESTGRATAESLA
ncbi:MAG TPA: hypothetical protein VHE80_05510 [Acidimicrobiales bacterium]|nr:hypothetical protein [Acidimicrobiales bacterium]